MSLRAFARDTGLPESTLRQAFKRLEHQDNLFVTAPPSEDITYRSVFKSWSREADTRHLWDPSETKATIAIAADKPVIIMLFSDVHIGSPECDYAALQEHLDLLKNNDRVFAISQGDIAEWAVETNRMLDAVVSQVSPPAQQARVAREMIEDVAQKVIVAVGGNHELRSLKLGGFDVNEYIFQPMIDEGGKYLRDGGSLTIYVGGVKYTWLVMHGDGRFSNSPSNPVGKAMGLAGRAIGYHDIVSVGHTHQAALGQFYVPSQDGLNPRLATFLQAGSYKTRHSDPYAFRLGYAEPQTVDMPAVMLWPESKRVVAFRRVEEAVACLN